jgi:ribosomal protein S21
MAHPTNFWVSADPNESSEKRVARFKQWFNRARIGDLVKDRRYNKKSLTKRLIRQRALKREDFRAAKERNKFYQ